MMWQEDKSEWVSDWMREKRANHKSIEQTSILHCVPFSFVFCFVFKKDDKEKKQDVAKHNTDNVHVNRS
jgi:hypothetical protein